MIAELEVAFFLRSLGQLRYVEAPLELLADHGHRVTLLLEFDNHGDAERRWLERMIARPNFQCYSVEKDPRYPWRPFRHALLTGMEYVHFQGPEYRDRPRYVHNVDSMRGSPPRLVRLLLRLPLARSSRYLRLLYRALAATERALPVQARAVNWLERLRPDILVIADAGSRAALYEAFVSSAKRLGIPTLGCVSSWDNLTTRPRLRVAPHRLVVWNDVQLREAVEIHGVPAERVVVTGAPNFDQWFDWKPSPAQDFFARAGLESDRPLVLWAGSALNPWEPPEVPFVLRWLSALRRSTDPLLHDVGVLIRPHPLRLEQWDGVDLSDYGKVTIWPRGEVTMPIDSEQKADYYDSIYHSRAVVGINTSAMIEAAIIGRPVLSIVDPAYHDSQFGALHFSYLLESGGGVLRLAKSMEEHLGELRAVLSGRDRESLEAAQRFVTRFVRPHGLDRPATPLLVDTIEQLASLPVQAEPDPQWIAPLRSLIVALFALSAPIRWFRDPAGRRRFRKLAQRKLAQRKVVKPARRRVVRPPVVARGKWSPWRQRWRGGDVVEGGDALVDVAAADLLVDVDRAEQWPAEQ